MQQYFKLFLLFCPRPPFQTQPHRRARSTQVGCLQQSASGFKCWYHKPLKLCLMSAQVCAFLQETMKLQSGSLSLPENNVQRNKAAQFHSQLLRLNEQCRHPPPPHTQCNVCASYLIASNPHRLPLSFLSSSPSASCPARRRSAWRWQRWPPCFPR